MFLVGATGTWDAGNRWDLPLQSRTAGAEVAATLGTASFAQHGGAPRNAMLAELHDFLMNGFWWWLLFVVSRWDAIVTRSGVME